MITPPEHDSIEKLVATALHEDIGSGDLTAELIPVEQLSSGGVVSRQEAIICGQPWFDEVYRQLDSRIVVRWQIEEGERVAANQLLCRLEGPARSLVTGERVALNFLQSLSGTATRVRDFVDAVAGTAARILDTRKTLPGLRLAQKYAVRCGGGENHRVGLYDAVLIKENHIEACGGLESAINAVRQLHPQQPLIVEVESLAQLEEALSLGVERLLLDNFDLPRLAAAVEQCAGRARLEASGGVDLAQVRAVAESGVDFISIGSLTKDLQAIDLSMRLDPGATEPNSR